MTDVKLKNLLLDLSEPNEQDDLLIAEIDRLIQKLGKLEEKVSTSDDRYQESLVKIKEDVKSILDEHVGKVKSNIESKIKSIGQLIKDTETKLDVSDISLRDDLKELRSILLIQENKLSKGQSKIKDEILETISELVKDRKNETKEIHKIIDSFRSEIKDKPKVNSSGGGSMPLRIQVNGTTANTRYADINIVSSGATVANNDTTKITTITLTGGGGQSFENPTSGVVDGTNDTYVFTHNPVFLVADDKIIFPTSPSIASITGSYTVKFSFFPQAYVKNAY